MHDAAEKQRTGDRIRRGRIPLVAAVAVGGLWIGLLGRLGRRRTDRARWYQVAFWLMYRLGLIAWNRAAPPAELVALVEGPSPLPAGRALDLGCGTGTDTIYLASRGWDVTGVDMTSRALGIARRRAIAAGVAPRLMRGDVTRLDDLSVGEGYTLLVDFGCFHSLPDDRRYPYVAGVTHAAAPGATFLLCGFRRRGFALVHAGMTVEEIRQRFCAAGWELVSAKRSAVNQGVLRRVGDLIEVWCYQLRRTPNS